MTPKGRTWKDEAIDRDLAALEEAIDRDLAALEDAGWTREPSSNVRKDLEDACFLMEGAATILDHSTHPQVVEYVRGLRRFISLYRHRHHLRSGEAIALERAQGIADGSLLCDECQDGCPQHVEQDCGLPLPGGDYCHCGEKNDVLHYLQRKAR